jgi:hypothetical protein
VLSNKGLQGKARSGMNLLYMVIVQQTIVLSWLPKSVQKENKQKFGNTIGYPTYRLLPTGLRAKKILPPLAKRMSKAIPMRYTDTTPVDVTLEAGSVISGRVGRARL